MFRVRRRYQDFWWLMERLEETHPERIVPPLPEKNRMEYLGRFTPDFIRKRQAGLRRFLQRVDRHPQLSASAEFASFLQSPVAGYISAVDTVEGGETDGDGGRERRLYLSPLLDSLGDVLVAAFSKTPRSVDERFMRLRKDVQLAKGHLAHLERLFNLRVTSHQPAVVESMRGIAAGFDELSASIDLNLKSPPETKPRLDAPVSLADGASLGLVKAMLSRVSATMSQCAQILDRTTDEQEVQILSVLAEFVQYCDNALERIGDRDRRQAECEELRTLLEKCRGERDQIRGVASPGGGNRALEGAVETGARPSLVSLLAAKLERWKGVDPISARQARLSRVDTRIKDVEEALGVAQQLAQRADSAILEEVSCFETILRDELAQELHQYTAAQVQFHETNLVYWRDFLSWLEHPPRHLVQ